MWSYPASATLLLLVGCGAQSAAVPAHASRPARELPTCPLSAPDAAVDVDAITEVGEIAGARIFLGTRGSDPGLGWLENDGSIGWLTLPFAPAVCAPQEREAGEPETRVLCVEGVVRERDGPLPLRAIVADVVGRRVEPAQRWRGAPRGAPIALAAGRARTSILFSDEHQHVQIGSWDPQRGEPIGQPIAIEGALEPLAAWCAAGDCFVIAMEQVESSRRVVLRSAAEGPPRWNESAEHAMVLAGREERTAVWTEQGVLRAIEISDEGRPHNARTLAHLDDRFAPLAALGTGRVAARTTSGWIGFSSSVHGADEDPVTLGTDAVFIRGTSVREGLVLVTLDGNVQYDAGPMGFHAWEFRSVAQLLDETGPRDERTIVDALGDGDGSFDVTLWTRPGRVSALAVPRGDAVGELRRLIALRGPCDEAP